MEKAPIWIVIGDPLSGKSTVAGALAGSIRAFSVRSHFEPLRPRCTLPPPGTLLPDREVWRVCRRYLIGGGRVLDGFPGTGPQAELLLAYMNEVGRDSRAVFLSISKQLGESRALSRRVCFACDGGVNQAQLASIGADRCARCGGDLGRREDDTAAGFQTRWAGHQARSPAVQAGWPAALTIDGAHSRFIAEQLTASRPEDAEDVLKVFAAYTS